MQLVAPSLTFDGDFQIDGGDLTVQLLATPGHTPDHVSVWIPELKLVLAGDAAEFPFPWIDTPADMPLLRESLRRLVALEPFMVLPCHGETTTPDLLTNNLAYFDELERRIVEAPELPDLPDDWPNSDELPDLIGFPYEDALALVGASPDAVSDTYRRFHLLATRSMVGWLLMSEDGGEARAKWQTAHADNPVRGQRIIPPSNILPPDLFLGEGDLGQMLRGHPSGGVEELHDHRQQQVRARQDAAIGWRPAHMRRERQHRQPR